MAADPGLYVGRVMHHRLRPKRHRFIYRVFMLLLDIDRLDDTDRRLRFFSVERANLFSFYNIDHGPRTGAPLRPWVEAQLEAAGIAGAPSQIRLLSMPRLFGYVFNPLSVYYCYDEKRLFAIVYEVKNTFGEQHAYVLGVQPRSRPSRRFRHGCNKDFYVSPFIESEASYRFNLNDPDDQLDLHISESIDAGTLLVAALQAKRKPLTDRQLIIQALTHPFLTQKVIASIHYEALKLWLKGIRLQPRLAEKRRSNVCPRAEAETRQPRSV